jgi:hypothetical protein
MVYACVRPAAANEVSRTEQYVKKITRIHFKFGGDGDK